MAVWSKKPTTHTNAPRHWPAVELTQFDNPAINVLHIGSQLATVMKSSGARLAFLRDFVYEDGILRVPMVVEEAGHMTCVFAYTAHDKSAAGHYSGVRALLRSRENATAVYYGPEALAPAKPDVVLQPIDTPFFSKPSQPADDASFALWWATDEAPLFSNSDERVFLDRWFEALEGYSFLLLTAFLQDLELVDSKDGMYALPDQALLQPVIGPGDTQMLLHASVEEGLFLAFDETTAPTRRRVLLRLLADFAVQYRREIEARKIPRRSEEKGLACWRAVRDAALAKEQGGGTGLKLHAVTVSDGQPLRNPNATTGEDRAAQPRLPGREELDFGMDLADRVVARLKEGEVEGSSQDDLGGPNFAPVMAVKVGADVFERRLPLEDVPVAQAAAARALDEWPEAEIVAVICDGAIRENGVRTDVLDIKVENAREGRAASLFQRYRVTGEGIELVGRPTASPTELFISRTDASTAPPPDQVLTAVAQQALETIVKTLTIVEPSGMCSDDPEDELTSPSALVGKAGDPRPTIVRFMMQGPITAAMTCCRSLEKDPAEWVVFHIDDLVSKNGRPDRRLRLCVQRKQDAATAIFDQHYETPQKGKPFALRGGLEFRRWAGSMMPRSGS